MVSPRLGIWKNETKRIETKNPQLSKEDGKMSIFCVQWKHLQWNRILIASGWFMPEAYSIFRFLFNVKDK